MATLQSTPRTAGLPLALIAQAIPKLSRHDLERLTERLIDHLDAIDGDADIEEDAEDRCTAGDDGCGFFGLRGSRHWGSDREDEGL